MKDFLCLSCCNYIDKRKHLTSKKDNGFKVKKIAIQSIEKEI